MFIPICYTHPLCRAPSQLWLARVLNLIILQPSDAKQQQEALNRNSDLNESHSDLFLSNIPPLTLLKLACDTHNTS